MGKARSPRRGSMQFWPRKRSRHSLVRVRSWADSKDAKALGFIAYKAGMTHLMVIDNKPKSATKGEKISMPATILDCPPMLLVGAAFYKKEGSRSKKVATVLATEISKDWKKSLAKKLSVAKKSSKTIETVGDFDYLRAIVASNPSQTTSDAKGAKLIEVGVGGSKDDQLNYAKENLGKELKLEDIFAAGNYIDVHGVTKGKGFQGTTKRYGTPLKHHKSEKGQRGIGNLGAWTPKRVDYRVAQPGKMGNHQRTEYNKQIIKTGVNGEEVNPNGGLNKYGLVKNSYLLLKGSVAGPRKGVVLLTAAIRVDPKVVKEAPETTYISK